MSSNRPSPSSPTRRPGILIAATVLMAILCLVAVFFSLMFTINASEHGDEEGTGTGMLMVALAVIQLALTIFVWFGQNWARISLAVIVAVNVIVGLISGQGLTGIAAIVAVALMFTPAASAWFASRREAV